MPRFVEENPGLRISLMHVDCDLYQPTRVAIETLWPRVVRGGVVIFDDYGIRPGGRERGRRRVLRPAERDAAPLRLGHEPGRLRGQAVTRQLDLLLINPGSRPAVYQSLGARLPPSSRRSGPG